MKPIIGITSNYSNDDIYYMNQGLGAREQTWSMIANDYSEAIIKAGGIPVVIPVSDDEDYIKDISDSIDALILSGGADIGPYFSNQRATSKVGMISYERDNQEWKLIDYFYNQTDKPIFGICRGMQILNAYLGGNLVLDLPTEGYLDHGIKGNKRFIPVHDVDIAPDSVLYDIVKSEKLYVNSFHHQSVKDLGGGVRAVAVSEDNVIEAFESDNIEDRFIMAVQWHPEMMAEKKIIHQQFFIKLIEEARKGRKYYDR